MYIKPLLLISVDVLDEYKITGMTVWILYLIYILYTSAMLYTIYTSDIYNYILYINFVDKNELKIFKKYTGM